MGIMENKMENPIRGYIGLLDSWRFLGVKVA